MRADVLEPLLGSRRARRRRQSESRGRAFVGSVGGDCALAHRVDYGDPRDESEIWDVPRERLLACDNREKSKLARNILYIADCPSILKVKMIFNSSLR